jgi:2-methylcitrate dehydratase PrpD
MDLAQFVYELRYDDLPAATVQKAKACLLDTLGCILEGAKGDDYAKASRTLQALGDGTYPVIGTKDRSSLQNSVMLHAIMAHSTEFDDSHKQSKTHPGSVIIPAVLGAAALHGRTSGRELIAAIVAGYETTLRIGKALGAGEHRLHGWHATATCGIFGAAAGAARILGLNAEQTASALGSAGTQAAGIWAFNSDGSMSKSLHAGKAAQGGLLSAILSSNGFTGSKYILEAEDGGFFRTFAPERGDLWRSELLYGLQNPGMLDYEINNVAYKPYPCCRTTHGAIEAALHLQREHRIQIDQIQQIVVKTYDVAVKQCGFQDPLNPRLAAFSFAYVVASALLAGQPVTSSDFSEAAFRDPVRLHLHKKVKVELSDELDRLFPRLWPCELAVEMVSGEVFTHRVNIVKGDPLSPLTYEEREAKFYGCSDGVLSRGRAAMAIEFVDRLEHAQSLHFLAESLASERRPEGC